LVRKALKGRRDNVVLATKFHGSMGQDPNMRGNSRRWIMREVEESLRRLDTDHIDLYQVHRPDWSTDIDETLSALSDLVHQGKVRVIGSSTFPAEEIVEAQWAAERRGLERFRCEQPPYSIFVRGIESDVLPVCQKYGMGVIPWSPLAGGWLGGKYRKGEPVPTSGRARMQPQRFAPSLPAPTSTKPTPAGRPRPSPARGAAAADPFALRRIVSVQHSQFDKVHDKSGSTSRRHVRTRLVSSSANVSRPWTHSKRPPTH